MATFSPIKNKLMMQGGPAPGPYQDASAEAYPLGTMAPSASPKSPVNPLAFAANFMPQQRKPDAMYAFAETLERTLTPDAAKQRVEEEKSGQADKLKQGLAFVQQLRALPANQRYQMAQAGLKQFGLDASLDPQGFTDEALAQSEAALSAQMGIGPATPEPMTAYQLWQKEQAEKNAGNPTLFSRDIGVVAVSPDGSKSTLVPGTESKGDEKPPWTGAVKDESGNWITDPDYIAGERQIRAASGGGMRQPPSGYTWTEEGALAPIPGGPADPKRSGVDVDPKIIAMENSQSARWMPIQNDFQRIKSEYGRIKAMGQRKDSVGDLALTVSLTKMLDPGSVARESEVEMTQSAAGALQQAMMWGPRLVDGKTKLPDNVRKMMVEAAGEMFGVYEGAYDGLARDMQSRLTQYGLSPERVMMGYEAKAPVKPKAVQNPGMQMGIRAYSKQTGIPAEAISEFLSNPATPDEIAEFNAAMAEQGFGPNQAEALLKALQGGR